ncbi:serine--glyoxylate aminotransferase isoform B [Chlorella sorokiniana]|uniref:Serine--glyoxylate aminotransferase isoform B n=1 Tax=Chlorella sorokiniana TaxID=3076 RepID=A0A2P6U1N9_CHLSO|nr:serine--glyoxylate aminotransferase isoform B [Chlorella sorokiniana]|eukprot:PRW60237.1 serine--glyoxylate aminotransferase isoform B [Chlorella sorokiniana]
MSLRACSRLQGRLLSSVARGFSSLPAEVEEAFSTAAGAAPAASTRPAFSHTPAGRNHLFVPGPVNIHENVLRAMQVPGQNHRDPWFADFYKKCLQDLKMIFGTQEGTTIIFPGTGTGGWESALTNTLSPGDKVVTFRYGLFSHLWIDMMQRLGLDVHVIEGRWGDGAYEDKLAEVLKADTEKKIKAVCVVHNETTTGVTSDIPEVRRTMDAHNHPALLLVDGVSSIGALDFQFDNWRVDVAVTGSQKALSIPTGLGMVCASDKALAAMKTATSRRVYYDFADMLRTNPTGNVPYTPILPLLYGMEASLKLLREEGMANVAARHHRLAEGCRKAVEGWGLQTLCRDPRWKSDSLTVIEVPQGVDSQKVVDVAYAKYNLSLGIGLADVKGKVFRIGHLGNMDELMLSSALCGAEMALIDAGVPVTPGSGVSRAIEYWQQTAKPIPTREHMLA